MSIAGQQDLGRERSRPLWASVVVLGLLFSFSGCYHLKVRGGPRSPMEAETRTAWNLFWGLAEATADIADCPHGMAQVAVWEPWWGVLVELITLGIATPWHIEYVCAQPGSLGVNLPLYQPQPIYQPQQPYQAPSNYQAVPPQSPMPSAQAVPQVPPLSAPAVQSPTSVTTTRASEAPPAPNSQSPRLDPASPAARSSARRPLGGSAVQADPVPSSSTPNSVAPPSKTEPVPAAESLVTSQCDLKRVKEMLNSGVSVSAIRSACSP